MDLDGDRGVLGCSGGAGSQKARLPQVPSQQRESAPPTPPRRPARGLWIPQGLRAGPALPSCLAWCENED